MLWVWGKPVHGRFATSGSHCMHFMFLIDLIVAFVYSVMLLGRRLASVWMIFLVNHLEVR